MEEGGGVLCFVCTVKSGYNDYSLTAKNVLLVEKQ